MDYNFRSVLPDIHPKIDDTMIEANKNAVQRRQAILDTANAVKELNTKIADIQEDAAKQSTSARRWNIAMIIVGSLTLAVTVLSVIIGITGLLR